MNGELIIEGGKKARIQAIRQWEIYSGLLEGFPTKRMNNEILRGVKETARKFCGMEEVYVIEPIQTPIEYDGKYPFGEPAELPPVACIAEIKCYAVFRDRDKDFSSLALVWFQSDYAFPIEDEILEKIKQIPFSQICGEFNY